MIRYYFPSNGDECDSTNLPDSVFPELVMDDLEELCKPFQCYGGGKFLFTFLYRVSSKRISRRRQLSL